MEENTPLQDQESIIIEDEQGNERVYTVDAIIEMNNKNYILYSHEDHVVINQIIYENDQEYLEDITDEEMEHIYEAYQQALEEEEQ